MKSLAKFAHLRRNRAILCRDSHSRCETEHGAYHAGAINTNAKESNNINVTLAERTTPVPQREVVTVEQLSRSFWGWMKGEIDYGFSFARSNKQTQSTLHLNLNARTEKRYTTITADSLFSTAAGVKTNRHAASATFSNRLGATNWSLAGIGSILKSDQQQLDLRTSVGVAIERRFLYTVRNELIGIAGVVYTDEKYSREIDESSRFNNAEGVLGVSYSTYRFDTTEWINTLQIYPSITDTGRIRGSLDSSLYFKVLGKLTARLGLYGSYDTRPPVNSPKSDYGVSTSLGWSF